MHVYVQISFHVKCMYFLCKFMFLSYVNSATEIKISLKKRKKKEKKKADSTFGQIMSCARLYIYINELTELETAVETRAMGS